MNTRWSIFVYDGSTVVREEQFKTRHQARAGARLVKTCKSSLAVRGPHNGIWTTIPMQGISPRASKLRSMIVAKPVAAKRPVPAFKLVAPATVEPKKSCGTGFHAKQVRAQPIQLELPMFGLLARTG